MILLTYKIGASFISWVWMGKHYKRLQLFNERKHEVKERPHQGEVGRHHMDMRDTKKVTNLRDYS